MKTKLKYPTKSHKGIAGRKPAELPSFFLRLRATEEDKQKIYSMLTGDATQNAALILSALQKASQQ